MVHNLPENFYISDFDVFHSALVYGRIPDRIRIRGVSQGNKKGKRV